MYTIKDSFFVQKFNFGLCRVHIDVHCVCREIQMQYTCGDFADHDLITVGFFQRSDEQF